MTAETDRTVREFVEGTSQRTPTPGGGAAAALAGALGSAVASMSARFTIGPERFRERAPVVRDLLGRIEDRRSALMDIVEKDVQAYGRFHAATELPRDDPSAAWTRRQAMDQTIEGALEVPLECARICCALLEDIAELVPLANPRLLSDLGVSATLARAGCQAAGFSVLVNLRQTKPDGVRAARAREIEELRRRAGEKCLDISTYVEAFLQDKESTCR